MPAEVKPNYQNLNAVKSSPTSVNLTHLRQFLGLTPHYRHFIKDYAKIAHPLYALTKKGAIFKWTADCEVAFECLQSKLLAASATPI